jgi:Ni/Co efflux regulator RcnB
MKRPVILVLMASLLASGSVLARENSKDAFATKMARAAAEHNRGNDRGHDRGHDRGNDRGHDRSHGRNDRPRDHRDHNPSNHDRRDWDRRNDHNRHDRNRHDWNDRRHDNNRWDHYRGDWNRHPNYWDNRRHDRADHARYRYRYGAYRAPHGYYHRVWRRGDHLPRGWYGSSYVVYDWRPYRLYSPPYGYHWVRVGNDVLLTAVATGIVLDVIYDIWY